MATHATIAQTSSFSASSLIAAYLLGGITFIPIVIACILLHAHLTLPTVDQSSFTSPPLDAKNHGEDTTADAIAINNDDDEARAKKEINGGSSSEPAAAANYFAVCREYVPGGVNGKPPERTTPAGETIAAESPSVYQAMYRSIFDRGGKTQAPSMESATSVGGKMVKKARNVFYVVLRHGHLLLFNNENQLEMRHVISLANYDTDIYAGGEEVPEGELFIKRNCIRLSRKQTGSSATHLATPSAPYYLFSDNCSEKEDFYHALLGAMEKSKAAASDATSPPATLLYESEDMIKLIRQLHTTEDNSQTRWINALIGRIFLGVYKTGDAEQYVRNKVTKKIARVSKPSWITSLRLEDINLGDSAPHFSNPKLKEMTVDGGLTLEVDVKYTGNFKLVVAAVARLELGSRFKAREVNLVLAGTLKKLEGHLLVHIKPPPSNRLWISFEAMPRIDLSIEPIVSSRQITYSVILRVIESRVREVITETVVLPNWDDTPFFDTMQQPYRGGIWKSSTPSAPTESQELVTDESKASADVKPSITPEPVSVAGTSPPSPSIGVATDVATHKRVNSLPSTGLSDGQERSTSDNGPLSPRKQSRMGNNDKPRYLRSNSFATAALPIVSKTPSVVESPRPNSRGAMSKDAATAMKILHQRSPEASPVGSPQAPSLVSTSLPKDTAPRVSRSNSAASSKIAAPTAEQAVNREDDDDLLLPFASDDLSGSVPASSSQANGSHEKLAASDADSRTSLGDGSDLIQPEMLQTPRKVSHASTASGSKKSSFNAQLNAGLSTATSAAKTWGWNVLKQAQSTTPSRLPRSAGQPTSNQPVGRGQPLPPPGVPLPNPAPDTWSAATMNAFRRKPVLPPRPLVRNSSSGDSASSIPRPALRNSASRETLQAAGCTAPGDDDSVSGTTLSDASVLDGAILSDGNALGGTTLGDGNKLSTGNTPDQASAPNGESTETLNGKRLSIGVTTRGSGPPTPTSIDGFASKRRSVGYLSSRSPSPSLLPVAAASKRTPAAVTAATLAFAGRRTPTSAAPAAAPAVAAAAEQGGDDSGGSGQSHPASVSSTPPIAAAAATTTPEVEKTGQDEEKGRSMTDGEGADPTAAVAALPQPTESST